MNDKEILLSTAFAIKCQPDRFFNEYEDMMAIMKLSDEKKAKIRLILEPEAKRRGLR